MNRHTYGRTKKFILHLGAFATTTTTGKKTKKKKTGFMKKQLFFACSDYLVHFFALSSRKIA